MPGSLANSKNLDENLHGRNHFVMDQHGSDLCWSCKVTKWVAKRAHPRCEPQKMQKLILTLEGLSSVPYSWLQLLLYLRIQLRRCSHGIAEIHSPVQSLRLYPFTPRSVQDTLLYGIHTRMLYPNKHCTKDHYAGSYTHIISSVMQNFWK